jgi:peptide/nickel transport system ATP-binding protein
MTLLEVDHLSVLIGEHAAVHDASFTIEDGRTLGLIGESGSGKTLTALAIMGLLPPDARASGSVSLRGQDLLGLGDDELCRVRGDRIAMIFQEPMTALNPVMRIGEQIAEAILIHRGGERDAALARARELLELVGIGDAGGRLRAYPHQLSGGQRQRVMIAIAMACEPDLLIADEPTTALDVTVQAQILTLTRRLLRERGTSMLLITHDLPVVAAMCDDVLVMYGGRIVEAGPTRAILDEPHHPYTRGLVDAIPRFERSASRRLDSIAGTVPPLGGFPDGCVFRDRCARATDRCVTEPALEGDDRSVACWHPLVQTESPR